VHGHTRAGAGVGVGVGCMGRQGRGMLAVEEGGAGGMLRDVLWPCCTAWPHDGRPARPGSLLCAVCGGDWARHNDAGVTKAHSRYSVVSGMLSGQHQVHGC
jgi:hypothetical protein